MSSARSIMSVYRILHGKEIVCKKERPPHSRPPLVGDTVTLPAGNWHPSRIGTEGVIISEEEGLYEIDFGGYKWWLDENEFELKIEQ